MKIIKTFLLLLVVSLSFGFSSLALAESDTIKGLDAAANKIPAFSAQTGDNTNAKEEILKRVGGLVGLALSFVGIIFLVLIIYAGLQWMTAQGNSGQVDKAKELMINAVIGLVIVTAAYSITLFIGKEFTK